MLNEKTNSVHFHKIRYPGKYVTLGYWNVTLSYFLAFWENDDGLFYP